MDRAKNKLGLWTSTSLVAGNMIGSGVFLLPAALASFGGISLLGWFFSALGALALALVFSYLSRLIPKAGGPYAYTREGFGDFAGFLVAWGYWISIWCGNAAITVAFVSYLTVFIPELAQNNLMAVGAGLSAIWLLTWVNIRGVKTAGIVQLVTTVLKLIPLILIGIGGLFFVNLEHFQPFNLSDDSAFGAVTATATLTLWAFLGLESATIPADNIEQPEKTIPRATILGTLISTVVYITGTIAVLGLIAPSDLQNSTAPFADAAAAMLGESAYYWVGGAAIIATLGALNGWILMQGQVPMAVAQDKLFPALFGKQNRNQVPVVSIIISSVLLSVLMVMNFTRGLVDTFKFVILLATLTVLVPYLFSTASFVLVVAQKKFGAVSNRLIKMILGFLAFGYALWAVAGSGEEVVYWGFILLIAGIPFYVWIKWKNYSYL
ncbi:MAG: amino acid permease [Cyclobacteriaceae bacterium]|nr:amino acid permease [Cyclobacteriaceae bacterium]